MIDVNVIEYQRKIHYYVFIVKEKNPYKHIIGVFYDITIAKKFIYYNKLKYPFNEFLLLSYYRLPTLDDIIYEINKPIIETYKPLFPFFLKK